jgi:hypothetical protein
MPLHEIVKWYVALYLLAMVIIGIAGMKMQFKHDDESKDEVNEGFNQQ